MDLAWSLPTGSCNRYAALIFMELRSLSQEGAEEAAGRATHVRTVCYVLQVIVTLARQIPHILVRICCRLFRLLGGRCYACCFVFLLARKVDAAEDPQRHRAGAHSPDFRRLARVSPPGVTPV